MSEKYPSWIGGTWGRILTLLRASEPQSASMLQSCIRDVTTVTSAVGIMAERGLLIRERRRLGGRLLNWYRLSQAARDRQWDEWKPEETPKKCRRCRNAVAPGRSLCLRHIEIHRTEGRERARRNGSAPWQPGGKGRPPVELSLAAEIAPHQVALEKALVERAAIDRRIDELRTELSEAMSDLSKVKWPRSPCKGCGAHPSKKPLSNGSYCSWECYTRKYDAPCQGCGKVLQVSRAVMEKGPCCEDCRAFRAAQRREKREWLDGKMALLQLKKVLRNRSSSPSEGSTPEATSPR